MGEDDKIIAVHIDDPEYMNFETIEQLPSHRMREIQRFFLDYKTLEHKEVVMQSIQGPAEALRVLLASAAYYSAHESEMRATAWNHASKGRPG
jgi:inorganic pyrophosphatase